MHLSILTSKGQTTIPKGVRAYLNLKPRDKIIYIPDGKRVFLTPVRGTILDLKGVIKQTAKKPIDFHKLREEMKKKVVKEAMKEMK